MSWETKRICIIKFAKWPCQRYLFRFAAGRHLNQKNPVNGSSTFDFLGQPVAKAFKDSGNSTGQPKLLTSFGTSKSNLDEALAGFTSTFDVFVTLDISLFFVEITNRYKDDRGDENALGPKPEVSGTFE